MDARVSKIDLKGMPSYVSYATQHRKTTTMSLARCSLRSGSCGTTIVLRQLRSWGGMACHKRRND
jgi:hypothetical protein